MKHPTRRGPNERGAAPWRRRNRPEGERQGLRLARQMLGDAASLIVVATVYVHAASGLVPYATAHVFAALVLACVLGFTAVVVTGFNRRFADPSLTAAQMITSGVVISYLAYVAPALRPLLTPFYMVALLFGAFRLLTRQQLFISGCFVLLFGAAIALSDGLEALRAGVPLLLHLALFLGAMSLIGGYVNRIRTRLRAANASLAEALEKIERMASYDELTGLYNRRVIEELADKECRRADRSGAAVCVALVDVDHFKRVNDQFGHATGDAVLRALAQTLGGMLRATEHVGRYGGEEFLVVLADTTANGATVPLERLRAGVQRMRVPTLPEGEQVTISIGAAERRRGEDLRAAIQRADASLYEAKRGGRNRVAWAAA
jgi:diguanylate cyclase (GGDEF)-like protein